MTPHPPSLRQLRYLLALHEHGHFGRAADAVAVSQSTLSAGLADLEARVGLTLVERTKRSVRFTEVGEAFVARAAPVLRGAHDLAEFAKSRTAPLSAPVRLAVIPTIAPFVLPRILRPLRAAWPAMTLSVRELPTPQACLGLARGHHDCVLLALPFPCGEVETQHVMVDALMLALPAEEARAGVKPSDIDPARLLLLEDGHCLKDHALAACGRAGEAIDGAVVATSLHTLVQLAAGGFGITLLPVMAVAHGVLDGTGLAAVPIAGSDATREIALAWRKGSARATEFRLLAGTLATALTQGATKLALSR